MKRSTRLLCFATALVLGTFGSNGVVRADMYTVTSTVPQQVTDFTVGVPVAAFNQSLGILTRVDITLTASGTFAGTVKNNSANTADFSVTEFVNLTLSGHSIAALTPTLTETQFYTAVPTGTTVPFGPFSPTATSGTDVFTSGAVFDLFNGGGTVNGFTLATVTGTITSGGGGNVRTTLSTIAGGVLNVTYTYTPTIVPEPASMTLIALGGTFGLVAFRVRRKVNLAAL
jgi:hypothetical protein